MLTFIINNDSISIQYIRNATYKRKSEKGFNQGGTGGRIIHYIKTNKEE